MAKAIDISRADVRSMANTNHQPVDEWQVRTVDDVVVTSDGVVVCQRCSQPWPCATKVALEEYYEQHSSEITGKG
jgi:hypothetical protein